MSLYKDIIRRYYNNTILLGPLQVEAIAMSIAAKSPQCNMLVFGAGNDSILWAELINRLGSGKIIFLETSAEWIKKIKNEHPQLDIRLYDLYGSTVEASLKSKPEWRDPPHAITECVWDIILIDGPGGFNNKAPGRAYPIMWACKYRTECTCVFVDDYNRELERVYTDKYLGPVNILVDPNRINDKRAVLAFTLGKNDNLPPPEIGPKPAERVGSAINWQRWERAMLNIAGPVLSYGAEDRLKDMLQPRVSNAAQKNYAHLEAVARTICGIAPWLEAFMERDEEKSEKYAAFARKAISNLVTPSANDYVNVDGKHSQPLCDAAFLAQGILRAKRTLWDTLDESTKDNIIEFFLKTRKIRPARHNWVLFSAMVETFLHEVNALPSYAAIDYALSQFDQWFIGDGFYKDGCRFAFDYYNSFVIHPMILDIAGRMSWISAEKYADFINRARRFAEFLYQLISPEGFYPLIGRSITYRMGAFHILSQLIYADKLGDNIAYGALRSAMTSVLNHICDSNIYDNNGFLKIGVIGEQKGLAQTYINPGSEYLCLTFFLPLGLPPEHRFWSDPDEDWLSRKLWKGVDPKSD